MIKVDLHLHSRASSKSAGFFSEKFGIQESYVSPRELYDTLFEKGMTLFTITDHDAIDGCLEIRDLPGVFLSEEITAYFPEDRCKIHVIALDITEAQHEEIQRLRYNVYDLVDYLQLEEITHILAHPLYDMDGKLSKEHVEKLLLLFDNWEIINGTRSGVSSRLTEEIAQSYEGPRLEELAAKHGFNKRLRRRISFSAGTDDHAGMDYGTTYTQCPGSTVADLKKAFENGTTTYQGSYGSPVRLTHMIMNISYNCLRDQTGSSGLLLDYLFGEPKSTLLNKFLGLPKVREGVAKIAGLSVEAGEGDKHLQIHSFFKNFFPTALASFKAEEHKFDIEKLSTLVGKSIFSAIPTLFYVSTYWQRALEKKRSRQIFRTMVKAPKYYEGKVAYFTDTLNEINGVALTSRKLLQIAKEENYDLTFVTAYDTPVSEDPFHKNFDPLISFPLPEYEELKINIPHFLDMLEYCDRENFDVIYAATPGVVGIYAFFIAKILHLPFVTTFHTDFPGYVGKYTGDHLFEEHVWNAFSMMFNNASKVLSPSREYKKILAANGVKKKKIEVFTRGVNHERLDPGFREEGFWKRFDPAYKEEQKVVLFVGRVAREKNLDVFLQTYELFRDREDVKFVIVGDGPYMSQIRPQYEGNVIFAGYLEGEDLSKAFASADLFFFPSMSETFGNVVLEAQASGLPVVVSSVGAVTENVQKGVTGFVVDDNNPFTYAEKLRLLLDDDGQLERMKNAAVEFMKDKGERDLLLKMIEIFTLGRLKRRKEPGAEESAA